MASWSRKEGRCIILVVSKFLPGPLNREDLGSILKAVDRHINDLSVTEKEGAAALAMSRFHIRCSQFGCSQASGVPSSKCLALARGEGATPGNTRLLR